MADLKQLARRIFHETLMAIDIPVAMQRKLRRRGMLLHCNSTSLDLGRFSKICVVAIGKAAHAMAEGLTLVLTPDVPLEGVVAAPTAPRNAVRGMRYFVAGHPVPNLESWEAAKTILALLNRGDNLTLVFFLLSAPRSPPLEFPLHPPHKPQD